jgi:hypothetical protein
LAEYKLICDPGLVANWKTYQKIADFEEGDLSVLAERYLLRYGFEWDNEEKAKKHFLSRQERLRNDNFVSQYLVLHIGHLSQPMTVNGVEGNELLERVLADATGFGVPAEMANRERTQFYIRDGRVGTLVDAPAEVSGSTGEARANREQSYEIIYEASQIWVARRFTEGPRRGEFSEVVVTYGSHVAEDGTVYMQFRRFAQEEPPDARFVCQTLRAKSAGVLSPGSKIEELEIVEETQGALTRIPFVMRGAGPKESYVRDIANDNCAHLNLQSVNDNILYYTGMQRAVFIGFTREEIDKWGESNGIMTANSDAQVLNVEPAYPQGILETLATLERKIHRRGKFQFNQLAEDSRESPSLESKQLDLTARKDVYDRTLDMMERMEEEIWRLHAEYANVSTEGISVKIRRDYGFDDQASAREQRESTWTKAGELGVLGVQKEVLKVEVEQLPLSATDGVSVEDRRKELMRQIDAADPTASRAGDLFGSLGGNLFQSATPDAET